ncbi:MAG: T9SS type A sorting domain-containing protein [Bacteroidetes bacterium]|nr:T9SS type A sorting domain-containing protein [Bacteroidota bacterium]
MEAVPMRPFIKFLFVILLCNYTIFSSHGQYVTIDGRQFKDEHDSNFYPVVCNYMVGYFYTSDTASYDTASLLISPESDNWAYNCDGVSTCDTQFYHNFLQIKHMNFNTIRLFGATAVYSDTVGGIRGFRIDATHRKQNGDPDKNNRHVYLLDSLNLADSKSQRMLHLVDRILVQANHAGLKVILLTGGAKGRFYSALDTAYPIYLSALSHHVANHSPQAARDAIMAYDMLNEPYSSNQIGYPWPGGPDYSKRAVCNRVGNWYNALKTNDPGHLITMGAGAFFEVLEYDLNVMKLDFASPHFYAGKTSYEPALQSLDDMVKRFHGNLYWLNKNSVMPYIIGETGFSAQSDIYASPGTDGTLSEQRQYAERTLQLTRDCMGSGYSWWKYQNSYWDTTNRFQDCLGLLDWGICTPPCDSLEKPVVQAFENFDPTGPLYPCTPPVNYFNLWNHPILTPDNSIEGYVKDDHGHCIEDAVVFGTTYLYTTSNGRRVDDEKFTFTDTNGYFRVIPYDYEYPPIPNKIKFLKISSPGSIRALREDTTSGPPLINQQIYNLTQKRWDYDGKLLNDTIHASAGDTILQGWNSMDIANVLIDAGSNVTINARNRIEINHEFEALYGSEVMIECVPTFPICNDFDNNLKKLVDLKPKSISNENLAVLELNFLLPNDVFKFSVYPNPGSGYYTIKIFDQKTTANNFHIEILNFLGVNMVNMITNETTLDIDISSFTKGVYIIKISTKSDFQTQKIILQ